MRFIVLCQATEHSSRRLFFCLFSAQGRRDAPRSIQCISLPFPFHYHIVRKISISFLMIHQFIVFTDYTSLLISQSLQILSRNRTCFGTVPLLPISRSHQHRLQLRSQIFKNKPPHRFCSMNKCLHLSTIAQVASHKALSRYKRTCTGFPSFVNGNSKAAPGILEGAGILS